MSNRARALVRDRRGLILVVTLPCAVILIGCIWLFVGMADAVLYRESLQDAADATAFESAVLHARGMNAAAALNIVMALLFAVRCLARTLELLSVVSVTLFGAGSLPAPSQSDRALGDRVEDALSIAAEVQLGVAAATPLWAAVTAAADNTRFYRDQPAGSGSLPLSYALLPSAADQELDVDPQQPWLLVPGTSRAAAARLGTGLDRKAASETLSSLPLELDEALRACDVASAWAAAESRTRTTHGPRGLAAAALGDAELLAQLLCGDARAAEPLCARAARASGVGAGAGTALCAEQLATQARAIQPPRPARVWSRAANGNVMLQTWASAQSVGPRRAQQSLRALRLLAFGPAQIETDLGAFAQAEYYFECPSEQRAWRACADHAAWSLGWRARLRRWWRPDGADPVRGARIARAFVPSMPSLTRALRELDPRAAALREPARYLEALFAHPRSGAQPVH